MTKQYIDELVKEEKNRYHKEWRSKNRDRVKQYTWNYWAKEAQARLENEEKEKQARPKTRKINKAYL